MKRFNTHIIMVSGQATPNVLAVMDKAIRPVEVILCTTDDMHENSEILKRYFTQHQIRCREVKLGNAYDFAALQEKFLELATELEDKASEVGVNLTGGTKLITIAAQQFFWQKFTCFYINPEQNSIQYISEKDAPEYPIAGQLKIKDFFAIHGYRVISSKEKQVSEKPEQLEKTEQLCRELITGYTRYGEALRTLNFLAGEAKQTLSVRNNIPEKSWTLLELFQDYGAIHYYDDRKVQFADEESRRFCQGFWLEEWVGCALKELNHQVKLQDYASSIVIESEKGTRNEIDAAFLYNNRLYLIECKTANLEAEDKSAPPLYKLDSLHNLPGIFTQKVLVSYLPLDSHGKKRAEELKIEVIEKDRLLGLATSLGNLLKSKER